MLLELIDKLVASDDEHQIQEIVEQIKAACVITMPSQALSQVTPIDGSYTFDQFMARLCQKRGSMYGGMSAYIRALENTDAPITLQDIKRWRRANQVPAPSVDLIDKVAFASVRHRLRPVWSSPEKAFLVRLYKADNTVTNMYLAEQCARQFGRTINEAAIKSQLYRLHRHGEI